MKDKHHLILTLLLSIFILFDIKVPLVLAELVDNPIGKIIVAVLSLCGVRCTRRQRGALFGKSKALLESPVVFRRSLSGVGRCPPGILLGGWLADSVVITAGSCLDRTLIGLDLDRMGIATDGPPGGAAILVRSVSGWLVSLFFSSLPLGWRVGSGRL